MDFLRKVTSTPDEVRRHTVIKEAITQRVGDNVRAIVHSHKKRDEPLQSMDITNKLVMDLETVFLHGLKENWLNQKLYRKDPYEMPQLSFWHFLMVYTHKGTIEDIEKLSQIQTDVGRSRAWIRCALNQGSISSYLSFIAKDHKQLKKSYVHYAYLRDTERMEILIKILDGLESFSFELATNSSILNEWVDTPLMMAGNWTPPVMSERGLEPVERAVEVEEDIYECSEDTDSVGTSSSCRGSSLHSLTSTPVSKKSETANSTPMSRRSEAATGSTTDVSIRNIKTESPKTTGLLPKAETREQQEMRRELLENAVLAACLSSDNRLTPEPRKTEVKAAMVMPSDTGSINRTEEGTSTVLLEEEFPPVKKIEVVVEGGTKAKSRDSPVPEEPAVSGGEADPGIGRNRGWSFSQDEDPDHLVLPTSSAPLDISTQSSVDDSYTAVLQKYEAMGVAIMGTPDFSDFMGHVEKLKKEEEEPTAEPLPEHEQADEDTEEYLFVSDPKTGYPRYFSFSHHIRSIPRELGMLSQNFTCKNCPRNIGLMYGKEKLCMYFGRYFCYDCHEDETSEIPSRVVYNWDFKKYAVCKMAKKFIDERIEDPFFNLMELNPKLMEVLPELLRVKDIRTRLYYLRGYLFTCKESTANDMRKQVYPFEYLYEHINLYSLKDFLNIRNGELFGKLLSVEKFAREHVMTCDLCKEKGFICEICSKEPAIFPFQTESTYRCPVCFTVYHYNCWKDKSCCSKCIRLGRRQEEYVGEWLESESHSS